MRALGGLLLLSFPFLCGRWRDDAVVQVVVLFPGPWVLVKMGEKTFCMIDGVGHGLLSKLILFRKLWVCKWVRSQVW